MIQTNPVHNVACQYRLAGLQVIPIRADGSKAPSVKKLKPYLDGEAECDIAEFSRNVGVGIVCGKPSGNLEVIDFDDPSANAPWCDAVEELMPGLVQRLTIVHTPRMTGGLRGVHVYYRHTDAPHGSQKLAMSEVENEEGRTEQKARFETKSQGGYVVAPGSPPACHETGRTYEQTAGDLSDLPTVTPKERAAMFQAAKACDLLPDAVVGDDNPPSLGNDLSPGDDFGERASWSDVLGGHKWVAVGSDKRRRPG